MIPQCRAPERPPALQSAADHRSAIAHGTAAKVTGAPRVARRSVDQARRIVSTNAQALKQLDRLSVEARECAAAQGAALLGDHAVDSPLVRRTVRESRFVSAVIFNARPPIRLPPRR